MGLEQVSNTERVQPMVLHNDMGSGRAEKKISVRVCGPVGQEYNGTHVCASCFKQPLFKAHSSRALTLNGTGFILLLCIFCWGFQRFAQSYCVYIYIINNVCMCVCVRVCVTLHCITLHYII